MIHPRFSFAVYLVAFVALFDQLTKWYLLKYVMHEPRLVEVTPFFNLVLVWNKGVTFGLLSRFGPQVMPWFLVGLAAVILFLLGRWLWRTHSTVVAAGLGLVMGGAIGNVIDRIRFGAVADFLDFHLNTYHWYAFNIADSAIVMGVALLLLDGLIRGR